MVLAAKVEEPVEPDLVSGSFLPIVLRLSPVARMTDRQFLQFCSMNGDLRIERAANGDLIVMPPASGESSYLNFGIAVQLGNWAQRDGSGVCFDSSGGFTLPNKSILSPDASWVPKAKLAHLSKREKSRGFPPLCPDFVIELRSASDRLPVVQQKMRDYIANGARLGWLIDPRTQKVHVYRPREAVKVLNKPRRLKGDPVLPGFVLDLDVVWNPDL